MSILSKGSMREHNVITVSTKRRGWVFVCRYCFESSRFETRHAPRSTHEKEERRACNPPLVPCRPQPARSESTSCFHRTFPANYLSARSAAFLSGRLL